MERKRLRILAVDDNPDNLRVLSALLADTFPEATVLTALDGGAGLGQARAEDPDVILLDIVMPEMDGFEVCRRLKGDELTRHIPVVFLTALRTDRENHIRALEAGGEAFLSKPIDELELTAQIRAMAKIKAANTLDRGEKARLATLVAERTRELERELAERRQAEQRLLLANEELESSKSSALNLLEDLRAEIAVRKRIEESLLESDARYRGLFEHMTEGCAYCRMIFVNGQARDWVYLAVNRAFERLTGLRNVVGKRVLEVIPNLRETDASLFDLYARVATTGVSEKTEVFVRSLKMWFALSVYSPERGIFVAVFDVITDRKRAEEALRHSLEEKESLLKEVHHRVKNNLQIVVSLLHLQSTRTQNPLAAETLRETQNRVRAMALLHETLYRSADLARIDFQTYLDTLCKFLFRAYGPEMGRLGFHLQVADVELGMEQAVPCGLMVSELVSNALKHAFPEGRMGAITVQLGPEPEGMLRLEVSDTGVGLPPDFESRRGKSLGIQLVFNLARQLRGTVEVQPAPSPGARVAIRFPRGPTPCLA